MEWRTIESAPKDGRPMLGFWSYLYHGDKYPTIGIDVIEWCEGRIKGWKDTDGVMQDGIYTHWMPLPEPPK